MRKIIEFILSIFGIKFDSESKTKETTIYKTKSYMSASEKYFYNILKELEPNYKIIPQINLASIIRKVNNTHYYTDLYRNIDFAIFDNKLENVLLLIEIDDKSHNKYQRKDRDLKVEKICNDVNIKLIHFYTNYPNKREYILNRVLTFINNKTLI